MANRNYFFVIGFLFLLLSINFLDSRNLEIRTRQLENINARIEEQERLLSQTRNLINETASRSHDSLKTIELIENELVQLKTEKREILSKISETDKILTALSKNYSLLLSDLQTEILHLINQNANPQVKQSRNPDTYIHLIIIEKTLEHLNHLSTLSTYYYQDKELQAHHFDSINRKRDSRLSICKQEEIRYLELQTQIAYLIEEELSHKVRLENMAEHSKKLESLVQNLTFHDDEDSKRYSYIFSTPKLEWPVEGSIFRGFGEITDNIHDITIVNNGIDIVTQENSLINSIDEGIVVFAEWFGKSGKTVIVDHKNGFYSLYANNSSLLVTKGEYVSMSQPIAVAGFSPEVPGTPILHFELRKHSTPVNPIDYLK